MDQFFTINNKNITDEAWELNISLNPNHPVYQGHFPQKAVVPGVMQTEMIKHILEEELNKKLRMTEARNIKFLNLMLPEYASDLNLTMTVDQTEGIKVKAQAMIGEGIYFKISAQYEST
jgi:3-hydroxyacyl-[acyl-carrier-protein] dehydratase